MNEKRIYTPLDDLSSEEINDILNRNDIAEVRKLPFSVGEYHSNWKFAQDVSARLAHHGRMTL